LLEHHRGAIDADDGARLADVVAELRNRDAGTKTDLQDTVGRPWKLVARST
jgi:hypothetical protein